MLILFVTVFSYAQKVTSSVSNLMRYGTGKEIGEYVEYEKEYFENLTDVRLFVNNFVIGFRLEYSKPSEYGLGYQGLRKKYVEFVQDGLSVRAGDCYGMFSRGLSLNLFENRQLQYDSGLEGIRLQYQNDWMKAILIGGDIQFIDYTSLGWDFPRTEKYSIRAGSIEIIPLKDITAGFNFVRAKSEIPISNLSTFDSTLTQIPEFFFKFHSSSFDIIASYALQSSRVRDIDSANGTGAYISLTYTGEGFGITVEYKDYRFNVVDPFLQTIPYRPTRMLSFQFPPIVHKEHSFTLLSRAPHIVDFNDEVGFQIDAFYSVNSSLNFNINASLSSRHYKYKFNPSQFNFTRLGNSNTLLPSLNPEKSPFWETYAEAEYLLDDESFVKIGFNRRSELLFNYFGTFANRRRLMTGIPIQIQYMIDEEWSIKLATEQQWMYDSYSLTKKNFYTQLVAVQIAKSPSISFGGRIESTTGVGDPNGRKTWIIGEGSIRIGTHHTVSVSYGSEHGGQVCTSGVCRIINPFNGFRLSILSTF